MRRETNQQWADRKALERAIEKEKASGKFDTPTHIAYVVDHETGKQIKQSKPMKMRYCYVTMNKWRKQYPEPRYSVSSV